MESTVRIMTHAIILSVLFVVINAAPKKASVAVESFQNQRLPDIPGYIPVYIKHEEYPTALKANPIKPKHKIRPQPLKHTDQTRRTEIQNHHHRPHENEHGHNRPDHGQKRPHEHQYEHKKPHDHGHRPEHGHQRPHENGHRPEHGHKKPNEHDHRLHTLAKPNKPHKDGGHHLSWSQGHSLDNEKPRTDGHYVHHDRPEKHFEHH